MRKILEILAKLFPFRAPVPVPVSYRGLVGYKFAGETLVGWLAGISGKRVAVGVVHRRGTIGFVERKLHQVELF